MGYSLWILDDTMLIHFETDTDNQGEYKDARYFIYVDMSLILYEHETQVISLVSKFNSAQSKIKFIMEHE